MRIRYLPLLATLAFALAGCSEPQPATFTGKVTYNGAPVKSGVIYFLGPAPKLQMGMGTIQDDGTYTATDVPLGEVRISFQSTEVPSKYVDPNKSELVYTITSKTKSLDINVPK